MGKFQCFCIVLVGSFLMTGCMGGTNVPTQQIPLADGGASSEQIMQYIINQSSQLPAHIKNAGWESIVLVWHQGSVIASSYNQNTSFGEGISQTKKYLQQEIQKVGLTWGQVEVHVHILDSRRVHDRYYMHGNDAVKLVVSGSDAVFWGSYAIENNLSQQQLREKLCAHFGLPQGCVANPDIAYMYAPQLHLVRTLSGSIISLYRGKEIPQNFELNNKQVQEMKSRAKDRLLQNISPQGKFTYVYNPTPDTYSSNDNLIRQFMSSRYLAILAQKDSTLLDEHKRNLEYIFATWYQENETNGRVVYNNASKLGSIALLLRALVESPYFDEYKQQAEKLATTLLDLQDEDGSFSAWWIEPDYEYDEDYLLTFYSGETILALLDYYKKTNQQRSLDAAIKAQEHYLVEYVDKIEENYYPAYVPWHTLSLYSLFYLTKDVRYAQAVFTLNDKLIQEMLQYPGDDVPTDYVGRFYNPKFPQYGSPHSASDGVYLEGLVYAYDLAKQVGDMAHTKAYLEALQVGLFNLKVLQYEPEEAYFVEHPERVIGSVRFSAGDNRIRIDTTQHMLDALSKLSEIVSN